MNYRACVIASAPKNATHPHHTTPHHHEKFQTRNNGFEAIHHLKQSIIHHLKQSIIFRNPSSGFAKCHVGVHLESWEKTLIFGICCRNETNCRLYPISDSKIKVKRKGKNRERTTTSLRENQGMKAQKR